MEGLAGRGMVFALASAASFGLSGGFAKGLMAAGWTPGAAVTVRILGAALVLVVPALLAMRGRWRLVRAAELARVAAYGVFGVIGVQLAYFQALVTLPVGVALLLEYTSPVLLVVWLWATTRRPPNRVTVAGALLAMAGLVLVLDLLGGTHLNPVGVAWGLAAAVGSAIYFLVAARPQGVMPPVSVTGLGMAVGGLVAGVLTGSGLLSFHVVPAPVVLGHRPLPAWTVAAGMVMVSTVIAYLTGIVAARHLGAKVASFVALGEVLFAALAAWALVGEVPSGGQVLGAAAVVGGIVLVRRGAEQEAQPRRCRSGRGSLPATGACVGASDGETALTR